MALLAVGMGLVMAPATESIMGSLPPAKAGVGSAMNDTTRQMGGALGVAVIGSILATTYRPGVTDALTSLGAPADVITKAQDSVGGAVQAAATLPAGLGAAVAVAARSEFVDAFGGALLVAAAVVAIAAVVVFSFLPARAHDAREPVEGPARRHRLAHLRRGRGRARATPPGAGLLDPGRRRRAGRAEGRATGRRRRAARA